MDLSFLKSLRTRRTVARVTGPIVLASLIGLSGCTEEIRQQTRNKIEHSFFAAAQSSNCCRALAELEYEPLAPGKELTYWHSDNLAAIRVGDEGSHAKGFELAPGTAGTKLSIQTEIIGTFANAQHFMVPSVMVLDERFNVLEDIKTIHFAEMPPAWFTDTRLEGDITLDPERHAGARYLVFYFDERSLSRSFVLCEKAQMNFFLLGGVATPVYSGGRCLTIPAAPDGKLVLALKPPAG